MKHRKTKKEKLMIVCQVDYDSVLEPNKQIYIPGLGLKKDLGISIIDVKDIKDVSFWANNVRVFCRIQPKKQKAGSRFCGSFTCGICRGS